MSMSKEEEEEEEEQQQQQQVQQQQKEQEQEQQEQAQEQKQQQDLANEEEDDEDNEEEVDEEEDDEDDEDDDDEEDDEDDEEDEDDDEEEDDDCLTVARFRLSDYAPLVPTPSWLDAGIDFFASSSKVGSAAAVGSVGISGGVAGMAAVKDLSGDEISDKGRPLIDTQKQQQENTKSRDDDEEERGSSKKIKKRQQHPAVKATFASQAAQGDKSIRGENKDDAGKSVEGFVKGGNNNEINKASTSSLQHMASLSTAESTPSKREHNSEHVKETSMGAVSQHLSTNDAAGPTKTKPKSKGKDHESTDKHYPLHDGSKTDHSSNNKGDDADDHNNNNEEEVGSITESGQDEDDGHDSKPTSSSSSNARSRINRRKKKVSLFSSRKHPYVGKRIRILEGRHSGLEGRITEVRSRGWWTVDNPILTGCKIHSRLCEFMDPIDEEDMRIYYKGMGVKMQRTPSVVRRQHRPLREERAHAIMLSKQEGKQEAKQQSKPPHQQKHQAVKTDDIKPNNNNNNQSNHDDKEEDESTDTEQDTNSQCSNDNDVDDKKEVHPPKESTGRAKRSQTDAATCDSSDKRDEDGALGGLLTEPGNNNTGSITGTTSRERTFRPPERKRPRRAAAVAATAANSANAAANSPADGFAEEEDEEEEEAESFVIGTGPNDDDDDDGGDDDAMSLSSPADLDGTRRSKKKRSYTVASSSRKTGTSATLLSGEPSEDHEDDEEAEIYDSENAHTRGDGSKRYRRHHSFIPAKRGTRVASSSSSHQTTSVDWRGGVSSDRNSDIFMTQAHSAASPPALASPMESIATSTIPGTAAGTTATTRAPITPPSITAGGSTSFSAIEQQFRRRRTPQHRQHGKTTSPDLPPVLLRGEDDTQIPLELRHLHPESKIDMFDRRTGKVLTGERAVRVKNAASVLRNHAEYEPIVPPPPPSAAAVAESLQSKRHSTMRTGRSGPNVRVSGTVNPQSAIRASAAEGRAVVVTAGPYRGLTGKVEACMPGGWYLISELLETDDLELDVVVHSKHLELLPEVDAIIPAQTSAIDKSSVGMSATNNNPNSSTVSFQDLLANHFSTPLRTMKRRIENLLEERKKILWELGINDKNEQKKVITADPENNTTAIVKHVLADLVRRVEIRIENDNSKAQAAQAAAVAAAAEMSSSAVLEDNEDEIVDVVRTDDEDEDEETVVVRNEGETEGIATKLPPPPPPPPPPPQEQSNNNNDDGCGGNGENSNTIRRSTPHHNIGFVNGLRMYQFRKSLERCESRIAHAKEELNAFVKSLDTLREDTMKTFREM